MDEVRDGPGAGWRQIPPDEWKATQRFVLDCTYLSDDQCAQIRERFAASVIHAAKGVAEALRRPPTQAEFDKVRAVITDHFNTVEIPAMAGTFH